MQKGKTVHKVEICLTNILQWQEKKPISIRCTRIGNDPHLRFIICKNNLCNEDFNEKQLRFFQIDNLNGCS